MMHHVTREHSARDLAGGGAPDDCDLRGGAVVVGVKGRTMEHQAGYATMQATTMDAPAPAVEQECVALSSTLEEIDTLAARLSERLGPVLRPEGTTPGVVGSAMVGNARREPCPLARRLAEQLNRAFDVRNRLARMLEAVDL